MTDKSKGLPEIIYIKEKSPPWEGGRWSTHNMSDYVYILKATSDKRIQELETEIEDLNDLICLREAMENDDGVRHTTAEVLEILKADTP